MRRNTVITPVITIKPVDFSEYSKLKANRTVYDKIKYTVWDPEKRHFFGKTRKRWGGICLFYGVFYMAIMALFAICMTVLMRTIDDKQPKWQLGSSLIGTNPGMGYRPMSEEYGEALIWYSAEDITTYKIWVHMLDRFLEPYQDRQTLRNGGKNQQCCDYDMPPALGKVCQVEVNTEAWGPCVRNNNYSYSTSSPCIFLKLNKIYGWLPDYYSDPSSLPEDMPNHLKDYIRNITNKKELNAVWLSCDGLHWADQQNIGQIEYYPQPGLPGYFYPYTNTEGYLSPLIAIHLVRPKLHTKITIECRAWAKNVYYRRSALNGAGSITFSIHVD